jgi:DNA-binding FadR family transcriptional regulator
MGTQSDLCVAYGATSQIFFQAIRVLIDRGLVELRQGNGGGLFAIDRSIARCAKRIATYLECIGVEFDDALQVSNLLQGMCVRSATFVMTIEQAEAIRLTSTELADADYYLRRRLLTQLFQQFAESSGNVVLALLYRAINDVMNDFAVASDDADHAVPQAVLVALGRQLADAAIAGDHAEAGATYRGFRHVWERKLAQERSLRDWKYVAPDSGLETQRRNLPERLADQILKEIRLQDWPVGRKLGNEPDLLTRYGVSRATFRQAIRLLEEYSAVETRRGPKGGLLIAQPNAALVNRTAFSVLTRAGATRHQLEIVATALAGLAMERAWCAGRAAREAVAAAAREAALANGPAARRFGIVLQAIIQGADSKAVPLFMGLLAEFDAGLGPRDDSAASEKRMLHLLDVLRDAVVNDLAMSRCALSELARLVGPAVAAHLTAVRGTDGSGMS